MENKFFKLQIIFCFLWILCLIQNPNLSYAQPVIFTHHYGATKDDDGRCVISDRLGNLYIAGTFQDSLSDEYGNLLLNSIGGSDIFLSKRDSADNLIWSVSFGGIYNEACYGITIDSNYNIILTGTFHGTVDFDPGPNIYTLTADSFLFDIFIIKLDSTGAFQFAKKVGGSGKDFGFSVTSGQDCSLLITGIYQGLVDFDPDTSVFFLNGLNTTNYNGFILKLNNAGVFIWAKSIMGNGSAYPQSIKFDTFYNLYVAGYFKGTIDFNPDTNIFNITSYGLDDIFLLKVDSNGNYFYVQRFGSTGTDLCNSMDVDKKGNIALTGRFTGTVDFNPDSTNSSLLTAALGGAAFLVKFDSSLTFLFAKQYKKGACSGGGCYANGHSVQFDQIGNLVYAGFNQAGKDGFIFNYSTSGALISSYLIEPYNSAFHATIIRSMAISRNGNLYIIGSFNGSIKFKSNPPDTLSSFGGYDIFLAKYHYCSKTYSNINVFGCKSFVSPSGLYTWNADGVYEDIILNHKGCDSIITINLNMVINDTSITRTGNLLHANQSFSSYQWLDCNNGYSPLLFQTGQNYLPMTSGTYAVEITKNGCKDTSSCYTVLLTNLQFIENSTILIYRSSIDTKDYIMELPNELISVEILEMNLFDINGKFVKNISISNSGTKRTFSVPEIANGLYFVRVNFGQKTFTKKLMIY